ncbi:MAG: helix-turn-helix domain-containing protein [Phenylobacterium sp.]|uniref:helix-turn-helix domain-containing protein n=1 Tax=Phenylobacterium sp. TaxID=1871053 RepID=UPI0025F8DC6A|nr:helix-turn-helix domain-containing protein [Phenylobacterium sp.]MCA6227326.1 helix-turn-helix domain-containing protein [Phenylobacterium sp.]MCA6231359.1 helix-turn-helix domain-containing protein [Phenylobacterium sp.]MCA6235030.1 helix-turn-helix domain-containing protein [Phenylobacterium sp.]MCA6249413.1 helix-turn-helix domain-containing protein [Phenylobacterium sp.]MCA6250908.1 helix-turn-helix domain-containing protein [Phenylobacterium sp.]
MILTPEACRAGRALLKWSMRDLAERSGVVFTTINRIEAGLQSPRSTTQRRIMAAFAEAGVEIVSDPDRTGALLLLTHELHG